jgi:hypothetical protein
MLYRATTSYFCAGLETSLDPGRYDQIIDAAPIIRWAVGKQLREFKLWLDSKGGMLVCVGIVGR